MKPSGRCIAEVLSNLAGHKHIGVLKIKSKQSKIFDLFLIS